MLGGGQRQGGRGGGCENPFRVSREKERTVSVRGGLYKVDSPALVTDWMWGEAEEECGLSPRFGPGACVGLWLREAWAGGREALGHQTGLDGNGQGLCVR